MSAKQLSSFLHTMPFDVIYMAKYDTYCYTRARGPNKSYYVQKNAMVLRMGCHAQL